MLSRRFLAHSRLLVVKLEKIKVICGFLMVGDQLPSPSIVQGSTVFSVFICVFLRNKSYTSSKQTKHRLFRSDFERGAVEKQMDGGGISRAFLSLHLLVLKHLSLWTFLKFWSLNNAPIGALLKGYIRCIIGVSGPFSSLGCPLVSCRLHLIFPLFYFSSICPIFLSLAYVSLLHLEHCLLSFYCEKQL